ncbi:hypothetical protein EDEG_00237 [Edhazardia aedis USNM 41457]|uniref:Secreted protein n=1 Tax=Edhazardia aedis (strain USNM 41457) TaxID=1003232 RepID=J9DPI0_EDHAE|nr:hypothetical protein EDEG_00237 [Edhazardia aedis USNM 41457]|eukprot:EJW03257.1 hypothetical protein EDEG_00237 [Edhazardia aedis USNM 41457]
MNFVLFCSLFLTFLNYTDVNPSAVSLRKNVAVKIEPTEEIVKVIKVLKILEILVKSVLRIISKEYVDKEEIKILKLKTLEHFKALENLASSFLNYYEKIYGDFENDNTPEIIEVFKAFLSIQNKKVKIEKLKEKAVEEAKEVVAILAIYIKLLQSEYKNFSNYYDIDVIDKISKAITVIKCLVDLVLQIDKNFTSIKSKEESLNYTEILKESISNLKEENQDDIYINNPYYESQSDESDQIHGLE